jgi:hypothetical protein
MNRKSRVNEYHQVNRMPHSFCLLEYLKKYATVEAYAIATSSSKILSSTDGKSDADDISSIHSFSEDEEIDKMDP